MKQTGKVKLHETEMLNWKKSRGAALSLTQNEFFAKPILTWVRAHQMYQEQCKNAGFWLFLKVLDSAEQRWRYVGRRRENKGCRVYKFVIYVLSSP